ncbi:GNAT family N-acetyltransferase [Nocardioides mangrovi]|uniref:GNAT family N-acetyltransferase n=1 Tax=Nocardioides mangrovi TaxID=2874580 RepID=A0ABS7UCP6_9ACTN|nr:GNAT family N-acetyltransferase [Nocardioides mangrovi]MBZ5738751.1 GNAT family N-acetyltransferase [Nocardioides mangrovi]
MTSQASAGAEDLDPAVDGWRRAREAAGEPPSDARVARVHEKVREPEALVVVARDQDAVVAMALLEPYSGDPTRAHVSMVFVDPERQRQGVGLALLQAAHVLAGARGWAGSSVWTRESNVGAQALYASAGYRATDDVGATPYGDAMRRWAR